MASSLSSRDSTTSSCSIPALQPLPSSSLGPLERCRASALSQTRRRARFNTSEPWLNYSSSTGASATMSLRLQTYVPLARTRTSKRSVPGNSGSRKLRTRPCQVLLSLVTSLNLKKRRRASELSPRSRRLPYYGGSFFATPQQRSCRLISTGNSAFPVTGVIPG